MQQKLLSVNLDRREHKVPIVPTLVEEGKKAQKCRPRSKRVQKAQMCQPRSERAQKLLSDNPNWREHKLPIMSTLVGEGKSPNYANLDRRGYKMLKHVDLDQRGCPSINGLTSIREGIRAFRAPKCRLRSKRAVSPFMPTSVEEDI